MRHKWHSVLRVDPMWPGEYQNAVDACGKPHRPWGALDPNYFECCTGTPCADSTRASAFVTTEIHPFTLANMLGGKAPLRETTLEVEVSNAKAVSEELWNAVCCMLLNFLSRTTPIYRQGEIHVVPWK